MERPSAILFDWDGTLVDTIPMLRKAHNHVHNEMGFEDWSEDEFRRNLQFSSRDLYPDIYGDNANDAMKILYRYIDDNHLNGLSFMQYVKEGLQFIEKKEILTGVVSNKRHEYLLKEIQHMDVDHIFKHAIGAGFAQRDKPYPDQVTMMCEDMKIPADTICYVGDTATDMKTAQNVGCTAILIAEKGEREQLEKTFKPYQSFASFQDFITHIKACYP